MKRIKSKESVKAGNIALTVLNVFLAVIAVLIVLMTAGGVAMGIYIQNNFDTEIDESIYTAKTFEGHSGTEFYFYEFSDRQRRQGEAVLLKDETLYGSGNSVFCSYEEIPQNLIDAFVAIEDKRFWKHKGVDWYRTVAASANYFFGFSSNFGASTITQQVIKNITGSDEYSAKRKIQEIFWAMDLEEKKDKREILEIYLNIINLSRNCYGVGAAAQKYYSKNVSELTLPECATIAAITNNPYYYDPIRFPEHNLNRRNIILDQMLEQGYITEKEYDDAIDSPLALNVEESDGDAVNTWYVDMAIEDVINDLCEKYGYSEATASMKIYNGGLKIYTAMDKDVQDVLDSYYSDASNFPSDKNADKNNSLQSAAVIIDPYTGDILGVAGAIGKKSANRVQNYATDTKRPAGSTVKPLSVYAPALERGIINYATVYDDIPVEYETSVISSPDSSVSQISATKTWPHNADRIYRGLTDVRRAVQNSVNTIAVKILEEVGVDNAFNFLKNDLKMDSLIESGVDQNGNTITDKDLASMALGQMNYGVTVREICAAYTIFEEGVYHAPRSYYRVLDRNGNILLSNCDDFSYGDGASDEYQDRENHSGSVVLSRENAAIMTKLMQNVVASGTAKAITLDKYVDVAGKTGTTNNNCDKWFIGYTPKYLCGVWFGYEYPQSLSGFSGNPCLTVWDEIMTELHREYVNEGQKTLKFSVPSNVIKANYCMDSGKLLTDACLCDPRGSRVQVGYFVSGSEPHQSCDRHVSVAYDENGGGLACPDCPPEDVTYIGLLSYDRKLPSGIYVADSLYMYDPSKKYDSGYEDTDSGLGRYSRYCRVHRHRSLIEESDEEDVREGG